MYQAIIVDDEPLFLDYLRSWKHWTEHEISIAGTFTGVKQALAYLQTNPSIDIIMTDIKMPVMNGIEFIEQIPARYKEHAYIVALSGYEDYSLVRSAFLKGASDYVLKVDVNMPEFDTVIQRMTDYLAHSVPSGQTSSPEEGFTLIDEIKFFVRKNLSKALCLNDIAVSFGYSPGYLSQLFSQKAAITIMDYVIKERIELSQQLLLNTERTITEIAYDTGFNSPEHFSRTFRKITGMSPREFRNNPER